jgi:hypothetical protein
MSSVQGYLSIIRRYIIKNGEIIKVLNQCIQYIINDAHKSWHYEVLPLDNDGLDPLAPDGPTLEAPPNGPLGGGCVTLLLVVQDYV